MAIVSITEKFIGTLGLALRELNGAHNPYKKCKVNVNKDYLKMDERAAIESEKPTTVQIPYRIRGKASTVASDGTIKGGKGIYSREQWTMGHTMSNLEEIPGNLLGDIPITERAFTEDVINMITHDIDDVVPKDMINTICKTPKVNMIKVAQGGLTIKDFYKQLVTIKQAIRAKGHDLNKLTLWQGPDLEAAWSTAMFDRTLLPASAYTNVINGEVVNVDGISIEHVNEDDFFTKYEYAEQDGVTIYKPTSDAKKVLALVAPSDCLVWDIQRVAPKVGNRDDKDIVYKGHTTYFGTLARTPFADAIYVFVEDASLPASTTMESVGEVEKVVEESKKGALAGVL